MDFRRLSSHFTYFWAGVSVLVLVASIVLHPITYAAVNNPSPSAKISFTFDDGFTSTLNQAAPTLKKYGLVGTSYIPTGCVGTVGVCEASPSGSYMTWTQIGKLKNDYGWEIGAHSVNHHLMSTLSAAEQERELAGSKQALAAHGINATSFATPYGDYNNLTLATAAKYYESHRGFWDTGMNTWPNNDYVLRVKQVQNPVTVAEVKSVIDQAIANKQWLVLVFHDIKANASTDPSSYQYSTANLDKIAAYTKTKQTAGLVKSVRMDQGLVKSDTNLLTNGGFDAGLNGWQTDSANAFAADTGFNGSVPGVQNAIRLNAGETTAHMYSNSVLVDPAATYMYKSFLNIGAITSSEMGFYIDEYDSNGNWISGQYKGGARARYVGNFTFTYKPTSTNVSTAKLQVFVNGNSGVQGFMDNLQMFPLTAANPVPPAQPMNLVANGAFDSGIADGWSTNAPEAIKADNANHGAPANPVNSVYAQATSVDKHLFSPQIAVNTNKPYSLAVYTNITTMTSGEMGFYIDEYDSNGNWISGQYKGGARSIGAGDTSFTYMPSSGSVARASLQVIIVGNSGITAYIDHIRWIQ